MDRLLKLVRDALDEARLGRDTAGRSDRGRHLAIVVTDLEAVEDRVRRANDALTPEQAQAEREARGNDPTPGQLHAREVASAISEGRTYGEVVADDPLGDKERVFGGRQS